MSNPPGRRRRRRWLRAGLHRCLVGSGCRRSPSRALSTWSTAGRSHLPPVGLGPAPVGLSDDRIRDAAQAVLDDAVARASRRRAPDVDGHRNPLPGNADRGAPRGGRAVHHSSWSAAPDSTGSPSSSSGRSPSRSSPTPPAPSPSSPPASSVEPGLEAGRVVVGIDGSELSVDATRLAFEEASTASRRPDPAARLERARVRHRRHRHARHLRCSRRHTPTSCAPWPRPSPDCGEKYPDVQVEQRLRQGRPAKVLADASRGAELVVVGSRGHGGFASLLLGSTSRSLLHHAQCPVLVVRPGTATS